MFYLPQIEKYPELFAGIARFIVEQVGPAILGKDGMQLLGDCAGCGVGNLPHY